jgi:hypothetical protein
MKNFSIPFVLTKFGNFVNDVYAKVLNDGNDPDDNELFLNSVQAGIDHFKNEIESSFTNPKIFFFDPNVDNMFVNRDTL